MVIFSTNVQGIRRWSFGDKKNSKLNVIKLTLRRYEQIRIRNENEFLMKGGRTIS